VQHNQISLIGVDYAEQQSPRLVDGLEQLGKLLHPEAFK
jgi:ABC-type Fe3+-hydroxamate transport system substrate-binding protein